MRYKDNGDGQLLIPSEELAKNASDDMLLLTAGLGIFIGIAFIFLGRLGKQMWIWVWGIGLIFVSTYLGISIYYGVRWFGYF
ncbi:MAG: hypothetical protein AAF197_01070 [Pseudomonadota bacterium]